MKVKVTIEKSVVVEVDDTKFTPEFMKEFGRDLYPYLSVEEHAAHIGYAHLTGRADTPEWELEGYGTLSDFGVKFTEEYKETTRMRWDPDWSKE